TEEFLLSPRSPTKSTLDFSLSLCSLSSSPCSPTFPPSVFSFTLGAFCCPPRHFLFPPSNFHFLETRSLSEARNFDREGRPNRAPFADNKYFSSAPLPTEEHIRL